MRRLLGSFLVLCALLFAGAAPAQQREARIALIIANEAYASANLGRLPGTQRDAALMRTALQRSGFTVTALNNLNRTQMRDAIRNFARQLGAAGSNGVGFFYYSGHGISEDPHGRNYLIPVDADISAITDLPIEAISLNEQLESIELAHARATIIVIDACRNTPMTFSRGGRGLAPVDAGTDTLIAFSTQPGETASDDGLYARVLSQELVRPGADSAGVFQRVQSSVAESTQRRQRPRYDNGLLAPVVFVPGTPPPVSAPVASAPPPVQTAPPSTNNASSAAQTALIAAQSGRDVNERTFTDRLASGAACAFCPAMRAIPSGAFLIGSPDNEPGREPDESPRRQVSIRAFAASAMEIQVQEWNACVDAHACSPAIAPGRGTPAVGMNWDEAQAYARWLSAQTGQHYRLLSESEWEYAARAGSTTMFWWGPTASHDWANYGADQCCSALAQGRDRWTDAAPVAQFPYNRFGLFDTAGNVWEWVQDCYASNYQALPVDGRAYETRSCRQRVVRGGSYGRTPQSLRSADRTGDSPGDRKEYRGFRVARDFTQ